MRHPQGNDAAYTLQALIRMAVTGLVPHHERAATKAATLVADASADAATHITAELSEWELAEDTTADGGEPAAQPPGGAKDRGRGGRIRTNNLAGQARFLAPDHGVRGYCSDCGSVCVCAMGCDPSRMHPHTSGRGGGSHGRGGPRGRGAT